MNNIALYHNSSVKSLIKWWTGSKVIVEKWKTRFKVTGKKDNLHDHANYINSSLLSHLYNDNSISQHRILPTCIWWDELPASAVLPHWWYGKQTVASCVAAPCRQTSWRAVNSRSELRGVRKHTCISLLQHCLLLKHLLLETPYYCSNMLHKHVT